MIRSFGDFQFDAVSGELRRNGGPVKLEARLARVLALLLEQPGKLVRRAELFDALWDGRHVERENGLNNAISQLRQRIGCKFVETVPGHGYRFLEFDNGQRDAVRLCRLARHFWSQTTVTSIRRAVAYYQRAIDLAPDFAPAHAGLADAYLLLGDDVLGGMPAPSALAAAENSARQALRNDRNCGEALACLGMLAWRRDWNWPEGERLLRAATEHRPNYATAYQYYSWLLQAQRRERESEMAMFHALELEPASSFISSNVGWMMFMQRRFAEAARHLEGTLLLNPHYALAHIPLGLSLARRGQVKQGIGYLAKAVQLAGPEASFHRAVFAHTLAAVDPARARRLANSEAGSSFDRAVVFAGLGDTGQAIGCLEEAVVQGSSHLAYLEVDPLFDRVRDARVFRRITRAVGLA